MIKSERFISIRKHLYSAGCSSVQSIATAVGASPATVRRDLLELEGLGAIVREHGGASISEHVEIEVAFEQREQQNITAKRLLANAAYNEIQPNSSIFLDAGTTVYQLARRIRSDPFPLSVFSNCLSIAQILLDVSEVSVTLLGGRLRAENASMVGSLTERALSELWFDQLFLGCGAIANDFCIYGIDADETRLNSKMLTRASRVHLLADSSKFGRNQTYRVAKLSHDINIISDSDLDESWSEMLEKQHININVVDLLPTHVARTNADGAK